MKVEANGISFNCRIDGAADAPWITFSNSLATDLSMWDDQAEAFAKDFHIFRYDTRGHGGTDAPEGPYSFELLAADVLALWDAVGIDKSHFVGLSLGGMAGIELALSSPGRLLSLAACDCRAVANDGFKAMWASIIPVVREQGVGAVVGTTLERWLSADWRQDHADKVKSIERMIAGTPREGYIGCVGAVSDLDYLRRLGEVSVPTLFLGGAQDPGAPVAEMDEMHAALPGSQRAIIDPAAHLANIENPDDFNAAIAAFVNGT